MKPVMKLEQENLTTEHATKTSEHATIEIEYSGTPMFMHRALYMDDGQCLFADVTGHDMLLRSIIANLALNNTAAFGGLEDTNLRITNTFGLLNKKNHYQSTQYRIGNGATGNAIIVHPAMTRVISTKDYISFGTITQTDKDHTVAIKKRMQQLLPAYIEDEHLDKAIAVLKENNAFFDLNSHGDVQGSFVYKTERKTHPSFLRGWDVSDLTL